MVGTTLTLTPLLSVIVVSFVKLIADRVKGEV
jgi:hypothetical protein